MMSYEAKTVKAKKPAAVDLPLPHLPARSGPTTFFLKSGTDMESDTQAGNDGVRAGSGNGSTEGTPQSSIMASSSFGVQSLADTIADTPPHYETLSRTNSNTTDCSVEAGLDANTLAGRKRKAGNPVHPKIRTAGQRILSYEHFPPTQTSSVASPVSLRSTESPFAAHMRRASVSSAHLSQPLTPLRLSPQPDSALSGTPRSASMYSFRLSDEDASVASETDSQAIQSSSGEEEDDVNEMLADHSIHDTDGSMPQLVMPSIAMPSRRPFTERGKRMGRLKVMLVGPSGVGKTSLLNSVFRTCEDIVHVDSITQGLTGLPATHNAKEYEPTQQITLLQASTKPYPPWWSEMETGRSWRTSSSGDNILDRNLCFIDTPGIGSEATMQRILQYLRLALQRNANMGRMTESEVSHLMSGEGGVQIDAVLLLYDPADPVDDNTPYESGFLQSLKEIATVIPVIARADTATPEAIQSLRSDISNACKNHLESDGISQHPFAVSSALSDDAETMDASTLMASGYIQPLVPSELSELTECLFDPRRIEYLKHQSTRKFLAWRRDNMDAQVDHQERYLTHSPASRSTVGTIPSELAPTSSGILPDSSKVLVPHSTSSYYHSSSYSADTETSTQSQNAHGTSAYALAKRSESPSGTEPFRRVRLARWAQDLQRSLENERKRFKNMYSRRPADWNLGEEDKANCSLVKHEDDFLTRRPAKGRLGGDLGIVDPRDPLGVLAMSQLLSRQGWFVLQVAGGCGLVGAVAYWMWSSWYELQAALGLNGIHQQAVNVPVVVAPGQNRGPLAWIDEVNWKKLFAW